ncbi:restriction endonuclease subunit S [Vibrio sp. Vb2976]|uniref:restriction endonuclease subunit S n=1 Tax=Vibrio sp. Vb2976 TaxID=3074694 RepID=UPI00398D145B
MAEIQTGISKSASRKLTDPIEVPYLRVANVQDGHLDLSVIKHISIERKNLERYTLKTGDVLLTEGGDFDKLGRGTVWNNEIESCVHQNHVFSVRTDASVLLPEFLSILTASSYGKRYFISCSKQSTNLASINSTQLKQFPVLLPSLDVQKSILSASKLWDNAIEKTEALIAAKEKQFEWLTQSLISIRCPNWKHYLARELFAGVSSKGHPDEELLSVTQDQGVVPRSMLSGRVMSPAGSTAGYKLVEKGNFVISLRSFQGGLEYSDYRGIVSPAYTVLSPKKKIHSGFYRHFFKSYIFIEKYLSVAVIGIRDGKQISSTDFDTIKIPYPDMEEQIKIALKLDAARQEINLLKDILEKYRCQKRGLMQKLLTGEWQVGSSQHLSEETYQEASA